MLHSICQQIRKTQQWPQNWKRSVFVLTPKKVNAKECSTAAAAVLLQSCPTLCDPIDGSPPVSPIPGILEARTLEWIAISFSNAWKWSEREVAQSCPALRDPMDCSLPGSSAHGIFQARVLEWGAIACSNYCTTALISHANRASHVALVVKNPPTSVVTRVQSLGQEDPLQEGTATHSSILHWRIRWSEEPGGLQSTGSHRVRHDWSDLAQHRLAVWITTNCGKFLKRWEYQTTLPVFRHRTTDMV